MLWEPSVIESGRETVGFKEDERGKRSASVLSSFSLSRFFGYPCFCIICACIEFFGEVGHFTEIQIGDLCSPKLNKNMSHYLCYTYCKVRYLRIWVCHKFNAENWLGNVSTHIQFSADATNLAVAWCILLLVLKPCCSNCFGWLTQFSCPDKCSC